MKQTNSFSRPFGRMLRPIALLAVPLLPMLAADPTQEFVQLARKSPNSPAFQEQVKTRWKADDLSGGRAWAAYQGDFVFAVQSKTAPVLTVDDAPGPKPVHVKNTDLWIATPTLKTGRSHNYFWTVDGHPLRTKPLDMALDVPAFGPMSYERDGVPQGKVSEKIEHTSKIYPGMKTDYWVYVPAQYDGSKPVALMVWQDGANYASRTSNSHLVPALDNLIHDKKIPVSIHVMVAPGLVGDRRMRSIEYDSVDDTYPRFLRDEILKEVEAKYKIRTDSYSRAIAGESSGAICAWNAAWWLPDQYSRVYSRIGSYTSIQWSPWKKEGGNIYPFLIRKSPKKNIRIWTSDGYNDLENDHGSWPLQNIQMANSLKMKEYDFHFEWGLGQHSTAQGNSEIPEALTWLWRGYDPAKTEETFVMDPAEKTKPYFRIKTLNRE